jgi:hypothetical protein
VGFEGDEVDENVLRFEVAVDNAGVVNVLEAL